MAEDREDAGEERHPLAVDLGELVAQVAHQRLRHGQTDGRSGHLDSSPSLVTAPPYEMCIDKSRRLATNVAKSCREVSRWLRIAVLGCGRIGRMHAANVAAHPRATLASVYDVHRPSADEVAASHGVHGRRVRRGGLRSRRTSMQSSSPRPTPTHADYIEQAVAAGKPVLCEKPIDLSLARVERLRRCASAARTRSIQLGFNRRFDPGHRAARDAVRAGRDRRSAPGRHHLARPRHAATSPTTRPRAGCFGT